MQNVTVKISNLVRDLESSYKICGRVSDAMELITKLCHHVVPIDNSVGDGEGDQFLHQGYWRGKGW